MCGKFITGADETTWAEYREILTLVTKTTSLEPRDCYPGSPVPIIKNNNNENGAAEDEATGEKYLLTARWGFTPPKSLNLPRSKVIFNLRDDRLSKTFPQYTQEGRCLQGGRCLLPAAGFYEWKKNSDKGKKQGFHIELEDHPLFSFAGVWKTERLPGTPPNGPGSKKLTVCSLLTTKPNDTLAPIHHRMPVILLNHEANQWLEPTATPQDLKALLKPCAAPMVCHPLEPKKLPSSQLSLF